MSSIAVHWCAPEAGEYTRLQKRRGAWANPAIKSGYALSDKGARCAGGGHVYRGLCGGLGSPRQVCVGDLPDKLPWVAPRTKGPEL